MAMWAGRTTSDPEEASLFFVPFYASSSRTASQLATANLYTQLKKHLRASAPYWDRRVGPASVPPNVARPRPR
jgi:hypothetical protein